MGKTKKIIGIVGLVVIGLIILSAYGYMMYKEGFIKIILELLFVLSFTGIFIFAIIGCINLIEKSNDETLS